MVSSNGRETRDFETRVPQSRVSSPESRVKYLNYEHRRESLGQNP